MKIDFVFNFILLQFFYLSILVFSFLVKLKKKFKTLINNFSTYFSLYNQTLESIFQFIFHDTIIHKKKNQSTFHENHLKKKLFFKSEIKNKKKNMFEVKIWW
jgi:hypothetical protein